MSGSAWLILIVLSVVWGSNFLLIAIALPAVPVFTLVAIRAVLAALILGIVLRFAGERLPRDRHIWGMFFIAGVAGAFMPFTLATIAITGIPSSLAGILNATAPFFGIILAQLMTHDEKLNAKTVIGVAIGFGGVVIMIGVDAGVQTATHVWAMAAMLMSAACFSFAAVYGKRFSALGVRPLTVATAQIIAAALVAIPVALIIDQPWTLPVPASGPVLAILAQALGPTVLAFVLFYRFLPKAGAVNMTLVAFLIPITAILLGAIFLHERLSLHHFLVMASIGLGLAMIDGRPLNWLRRIAP